MAMGRAAGAIPRRAGGEEEGDMSASTTPPHDATGPAGGPDPTDPATPRRRGATRVRPDADFELMLALRGAASARDLRNRVVRPRFAETRDVAATGSPAATGDAAGPRDLAHPD
jgi:hypothetical protein